MHYLLTQKAHLFAQKQNENILRENQKKLPEKSVILSFETARFGTQNFKKTFPGLALGLKTIRNFVRSAIDRACNKTRLFLTTVYLFRAA